MAKREVESQTRLSRSNDIHLDLTEILVTCRMLPSLIIMLLLAPCCYGENPAIQVSLTNKGLQYGSHIGAGLMQEKLLGMTFPTIRGHVDTFLGPVPYQLVHTTVCQCDFPEPSIEFYKDVTGFKVSLTGLSIALKGYWSMRYHYVLLSGAFKLGVFNLDLTSIAEVGRDANGRLNISSVSCNGTIGEARMAFYGRSSWVARHLVDLNSIKGEIEEKICPAVKQHIVDMEHHLQEINVSFKVNQDLAVDMALTGLPFMNSSSVRLDLKGELYSIKHREIPPFKAKPFTLPEQQASMLSVGLSEFTANSAAYAYYSAGRLQVIINDSTLPPGCPLHLNTSSFGLFIPQLPKLFPGLLMELQVQAKATPNFTFHNGSIKLDLLNWTIKAFAIEHNATRTTLFTLNVDSKFSGKAWIDTGKLKGSIAMDNIKLTLASSEVGPFQTAPLENLAKMSLLPFLAKVNEKLECGFVLPSTPHAKLVNSVLKIEEGFIFLSSDAELSQRNTEWNQKTTMYWNL